MIILKNIEVSKIGKDEEIWKVLWQGEAIITGFTNDNHLKLEMTGVNQIDKEFPFTKNYEIDFPWNPFTTTQQLKA